MCLPILTGASDPLILPVRVLSKSHKELSSLFDRHRLVLVRAEHTSLRESVMSDNPNYGQDLKSTIYGGK